MKPLNIPREWCCFKSTDSKRKLFCSGSGWASHLEIFLNKTCQLFFYSLDVLIGNIKITVGTSENLSYITNSLLKYRAIMNP